MRPALYLFVNKSLGMSAGKIAAQVAQATVGAVDRSYETVEGHALKDAWWEGPGHHHATYVMEARDSEHLHHIQTYLTTRGFKTYLMIDEGMTEILPITPTVLGVEIVDKDDEHVQATFGVFKLYRDAPKKKPRRALGVF